jgi:hypothetical protein
MAMEKWKNGKILLSIQHIRTFTALPTTLMPSTSLSKPLSPNFTFFTPIMIPPSLLDLLLVVICVVVPCVGSGRRKALVPSNSNSNSSIIIMWRMGKT